MCVLFLRRLMKLVACPLLALCAAAQAGEQPKQLQPFIGFVYPAGGQRGKTVEATVGGTNLKDCNEVRISGKGVVGKLVEEKPEPAPEPKPGTKPPPKPEAKDDQPRKVSIAIAGDAEPGERELRLIGPSGISNRFRFFVGVVPEVMEVEPNSEKHEAQKIESLPVVVNGQVFEADRDIFRFTAKKGQTLAIEALGRRIVPFIADAVPGWNDLVLTLYDAKGKQLGSVDDYRFRPDPLMIFNVPADGEYAIEVSDILFRGRGDFVYRLSIGELPYITHVFPLGGQRGKTVEVALRGVNLPSDKLTVQLAPDRPPLRMLQVVRNGIPSNAVPFAAGDLPELVETEPNDTPEQAMRIEAPATIDGRIQRPGDADYFAFTVKQGEKLAMEVRARRLDSPLDSFLTLYNAKGAEVAFNDDTVDPSEGMATHHADSKIVQTFAAAGDYILRLSDRQSKGGDEYAYRLTIAPPRPDFDLRISPDNARVGKDDTAMFTVTAIRKDGFDGEVELKVEGLPKTYLVSQAKIAARQDSARFTVTSPADAAVGFLTPTVTGTAKIGEETVTRPALPAESVMQAFAYTHVLPVQEMSLAVSETPSPFTLSADVPAGQAVKVPQGGEVQVKLKLRRKDDFKGAVTLTVVPPAPNGLQIKAPFINADQDESTIVITAAKTAPAGVQNNVILTGTCQSLRDRSQIVRAVPAIPVEVVAAPTP